MRGGPRPLVPQKHLQPGGGRGGVPAHCIMAVEVRSRTGVLHDKQAEDWRLRKVNSPTQRSATPAD